ncbi:acyl-CoA dehydrogenase family protein [Myxococcota bacterium]|nr:acyl-CoA dehydrogenase family protein [Myxococcota bacterium]
MDLRDDATERSFRLELRDWLESEVPPHGDPPPSDDWPARREYDTGWQRKLFDAGYAGIHWPTEYGGRGASLAEQLIYYEEINRAGAPYVGVNFIGMMHGGPTLTVEGSDEQKARHLRQILSGEQVWCQGFSEPGSGSDLASLSTRAERDGDHYVVSGQKIWTTYAQIADYGELLVRTDPDARKHGGISWLVLPMDLPGVEFRPIRTIEGPSEFNELFLDEVRVPVDHRVGKENDGWRVANVTLRFERGTAYGGHVYRLQELLSELARGAMRLTRYEGRAWDDRALRREVGHLQAEVDALWVLVKLSVAQTSDSGVPSLSGSAIKLYYTELYQRVSELAWRTLARAGLSGTDVAGTPNQHLLHDYLWAIQTTISAGTSQIQRNIVSERILGLPREP